MNATPSREAMMAVLIIARCCRDWPVYPFMPWGRCGDCGERPERTDKTLEEYMADRARRAEVVLCGP